MNFTIHEEVFFKSSKHINGAIVSRTQIQKIVGNNALCFVGYDLNFEPIDRWYSIEELEKYGENTNITS